MCYYMPTKINVMKFVLVSFKMYTWFTEKKTHKANKKKKNTKKKIQKTPKIFMKVE